MSSGQHKTPTLRHTTTKHEQRVVMTNAACTMNVMTLHVCYSALVVSFCLKRMLCATLQNSRKKYNSDSEKPAPWTWFKSNPNNPYKVQRLFGIAVLLTASARHQWLASIAADISITARCSLQPLYCVTASRCCACEWKRTRQPKPCC